MVIRDSGIDGEGGRYHEFVPQTSFPYECLPDLILNSVKFFHEVTGSPFDLAVASALTVASAVSQDKLNLMLSSGLKKSTGLYFITIAKSGVGKTYVLDRYLRGLLELDAESDASYQLNLESYKFYLKARKKTEAEYIKRITAANMLAGKSITKEQADQAMSELGAVVDPPYRRRYVFQDGTPAAFIKSLLDGRGSISIISSEAGSILNGVTFSDAPMFNDLWDGVEHQRSTKSSGDIRVRDPRVTLSLFVQPAMFDKFMQGKGSSSKVNGFVGRCLISEVDEGIMKSRWINGEKIIGEPSFFELRINQIAKLTERVDVRLSPDGEALHVGIKDKINQLVESHYKPIQESAHKAADNVLRLAAIFCLFGKNLPGTARIGEQDLYNSYRIITWYLDQQLKMFGVGGRYSGEDLDAQILRDWLYHCSVDGGIFFTARYIHAYGPNKLRSFNRMNRAIHFLLESNVLVRYHRNHPGINHGSFAGYIYPASCHVNGMQNGWRISAQGMYNASPIYSDECRTNLNAKYGENDLIGFHPSIAFDGFGHQTPPSVAT